MLSKVCAVVLPSLLLLGAHQGKNIDSYDEIVRFNMHSGGQNIIDFGSRTTLILSNMHALDEQTIGRCLHPNTSCVFMHDQHSLGKWRYKEKGVAHRRDVMYIRNGTARLITSTLNNFIEDQFMECERKMNRSHFTASTGYRAIYYLRELCSRIDIYGFELSKNRSRYNEYDTGRSVWKGHDYFMEHSCILSDESFQSTFDAPILSLVRS